MRRIKILKIYFIFILFILFLIFSNIQLIASFFMATLTFNIAILTIFSIGLLILYQAAIRLTMLSGTFGILAYKKGKSLEFYLEGISGIFPATIAHMFNKRAKRGVLYFTQDEAKNVSEWLSEQFFNQKGYTNFFVGTSLMLGLFGTFTGLLVAIDDMGAIILSFGGDDIDIGEVMTKFSGPLGGMSIGFASSLFGVASAVILNVMQYILTRNQAGFQQDVEDWMKGKIIDTQSSEALEEAGLEVAIPSSQNNFGGGNIQGFLDVFIDTIGDFTEKLDKSNESAQSVFNLINETLIDNKKNSQKDSILLENISTSLKELNVNQFSNASVMEESIQELSNVILAENKSVKKSLELQEENNKLLIELINSLNDRLEKLENKDK